MNGKKNKVMDASFLLYAVGRVLPRVAAGARCPRCLQAWITMPLPSSFKSHCLSQVRICFSLRDLLFNPTIRRLSTLHLQPHKLSPKRWSTCALGAEILPRSQWIGITSTAVVGEPPAIATPRVLQRVRASSAGARVPRDREASRK